MIGGRDEEICASITTATLAMGWLVGSHAHWSSALQQASQYPNGFDPVYEGLRRRALLKETRRIKQDDSFCACKHRLVSLHQVNGRRAVVKIEPRPTRLLLGDRV